MSLQHGSYCETETAYALGEDPEWMAIEEDLMAEIPAREAPVAHYLRLQEAFDFFNAELFENRLPPLMFTLRGSAHQVGYSLNEAFITKDNQVYDEIAINPKFTAREDIEILSTIVHEMTHHEQDHFGKPSKGGYHNKEWVGLMLRVGLKPYNTKDKSKQTGTTISHTIVADGPFEVAAKKLLAQGWTFKIIERNYQTMTGLDDEGQSKLDRAKQKRKTKYTCDCSTVWGRPGLNLMCCECGAEFEEQT